MYFLGVDGGGSGCRARLSDASGITIGNGVAGPATLRLGADASWTAVTTAADAAIALRGTPANEVHVCVGLAGISRASAREAWLAKRHPFASLTLVGDEVAACVGAHSGADGGIVIVGTGSNAFGLIGRREVRAGGHGFPISDDGSGAMIGLEALRMAVRAYDKRIAVTPLLQALMARFGDDIGRLVAWLDTSDAAAYASLAPLVVEYADRQDAAGVRLMHQAAAEIAGLVETLIERGVGRVALVGGLATTITGWMPSALGANLVVPAGDACDGAIIIARRAASSASA